MDQPQGDGFDPNKYDEERLRLDKQAMEAMEASSKVKTFVIKIRLTDKLQRNHRGSHCVPE